MSAVWRIVPQPVLSLLILVLWLVLASDPGPGQFLLGGVLALGVPHLTRTFWPDPPRLADPVAGVRLVGVVLFDIVTANIEVARRVVGPTASLRPDFLEVPLALENPFVATIFGSIVSLTPGTVSCEIDRERWTLLVHALHVEDPAAFVARIKSRYETPLKQVFGC